MGLRQFNINSHLLMCFLLATQAQAIQFLNMVYCSTNLNPEIYTEEFVPMKDILSLSGDTPNYTMACPLARLGPDVAISQWNL